MSDNKEVTLADIHTALVAILAQLIALEEKQDMREKEKGERRRPKVYFDEITHYARAYIRDTKDHIRETPDSYFE